MPVEWLEWPGYKAIGWNPVHGCSKISEGCLNCWADRMARTRLKGKLGYDGENPFLPYYDPNKIDSPRRWKKPHTIFVADMGDLFHSDIPSWQIEKVFDTIRDTPRHKYFILTKRPERMRDFVYQAINKHPLAYQNVWWGTSVELQKYVDPRIKALQGILSQNLFVSLEPLLGPVDVSRYLYGNGGIQWVIVGGESGPDCRPIQTDWVESIQRQCEAEKVPFYFKQWGGFPDQMEREKALLRGQPYKRFPDEAYKGVSP